MVRLVKNLPAMQEPWVRDLSSIPELGRSPGEGIGYPLQYSGLENSMGDRKESDTTEQISLYFGYLPNCGAEKDS